MISPQDIRADALQCEWVEPTFFLFSELVPPLIYYSHLFPASAALILFTIIALVRNKTLTTYLFLLVSGLFVVFSILDLYLWASIDPSYIMLIWSLLTYVEPLIFLSAVFLAISFALKRYPYFSELLIAFILYLPILVLGPTELNLSGFDYANCYRLAIEGSLLYYVYFIEALCVLWILGIGFYAYQHKPNNADGRNTLLFITGISLFLIAFASGNILGTLLQDVMGEAAWDLGQFGLLGMPVFLTAIMYLIVKTELFKVRLIYAEALVIGIWVLIMSLLFIPDQTAARPILLTTLVLFAILSYLLIRGVKKDAEQKKEIEQLMLGLSRANQKLKKIDKQKSEFVSIASHQLRSPLTAIRGYASMLTEGSFGSFPAKARKPLEHIEESARMMAMSIEDYLNVSRIESGNMKYDYENFNLPEITSHICDDLRAEATRQGLLLFFKTDFHHQGIVHADKGKVQQIIHNLINNSLKYTPKGSITVFVHDDTKKQNIHVEIIDTGIGMDDETQNAIFQKFQRSKNAHTVNVHGTGLGLFVAKKMANDMGGDVTAYSDGEGKGSHFILHLPLKL